MPVTQQYPQCLNGDIRKKLKLPKYAVQMVNAFLTHYQTIDVRVIPVSLANTAKLILMTVLQIHVKMMAFVSIKTMGTPVAVHQDTADATVKSEIISVFPLHPVKMEPNVLSENLKTTHVHVDLAGLANSATNAKQKTCVNQTPAKLVNALKRIMEMDSLVNARHILLGPCVNMQKSCHVIETINAAHLENAKISNSMVKMTKIVTNVIAMPVTKASIVKTELIIVNRILVSMVRNVFQNRIITNVNVVPVLMGHNVVMTLMSARQILVQLVQNVLIKLTLSNVNVLQVVLVISVKS